MVNKFWVNEIH